MAGADHGGDSDPARAQYFFVHVMKTGGATFRWHAYRLFRPGEVYPRRRPASEHDKEMANILIDRLLALPEERRRRTRMFMGHFPFVVTRLLAMDLVTLTILRDPVDRTVSYLRHCKRYHDQHRALPLEAIYEDPFYFPTFIRDHQVKMFAMTAEDRLESYMDEIDVDERRLRIAQENLEQVDVIGLSRHQAEFRAELERRFGWRFDPLERQRVSTEDWEVSPAFRRRIAAENAADLEFYEFARRLHAGRRGSRVLG